MKRIVITGPESTGKTYLSKFLSKQFEAPIVPEYAVEYLNKKTNGKYFYEDLVKIAKGQLKSEDEIASKYNTKLLLCDTDLITIKIWSEVRFFKVDNRILRAIESRTYDHYLLCKPDIPWEYSELRENPNDRDDLFVLYEQELNTYDKSYSIIQGDYITRTEQAKDIVKKILSL